jgi:hypothetical protein
MVSKANVSNFICITTILDCRGNSVLPEIVTPPLVVVTTCRSHQRRVGAARTPMLKPILGP